LPDSGEFANPGSPPASIWAARSAVSGPGFRCRTKPTSRGA